MKPFLAIALALGSVFASSQPAQCQETSDNPSYIAVELNSGRVLYSSNPESKRPVGSLAQIATACVALDWSTASGVGLDQHITVPQNVGNIAGPNPLALAPGETITLRDALYSMMLTADNAAAWTIAHYVGTDLQVRRGVNAAPLKVFVGEMNRLAKSCGMFKTSFQSPAGIEPQGKPSASSAADMALLSIYAIKIPAFAFIVKNPQREVKINGPQGVRSTIIRNTNTMLGKLGVDGIKTASSNIAGKCVAISATRDSLTRKNASGAEEIYPQRAVIIVLNSEDRMNLTQQLIVQGWAAQDSWFRAGMPLGQKNEYLRLPLPKQPGAM